MRVLLTAVAVFVALQPQEALAQSDDGSGGATDQSDFAVTAAPEGDGVEVVGTMAVGETLSGGGVGLSEWMLQCTFEVRAFVDLEAVLAGSPIPVGLPGGGNGDPEEEWGVVFCPAVPEAVAAHPQILFTGILAAWPLGESLPQVVLDWLVASAYAAVAVPVPVPTASPVGDLDAPLIAQLPTWLWVDEAIWAPQSVTTAPVFGVTATVTATPVNVTFAGADGEQVDCGPNTGPVYDPSLGERGQSSDCTLTYHHSSSVGDWTLSSTITWEVAYTCSAFCGPGVLPDIVVTNTREVQVAELQALAIP